MQVEYGQESGRVADSLWQGEVAKVAAPTFPGFAGIISVSNSMKKVFSILEKIAPTDTTTLILGETGTGKELIASAIHSLSGRKGRLVPVNCGAIPEDILESELFGHEKGAFTGAVANRVGRFQLADGGTIFLDEIGEMSPKLQVKLLRVLQERVIEPVGSTKSIKINVRIVAATNKDLREEVKAGRFREDLYFRLQVVPLHIPALRERGQDLDLLIRYFMYRKAEQLGVMIPSLCDDALAKLSTYSWPGNVRELENLMERLVVLCNNDTISIEDLPAHISETSSSSHEMHSIHELPDEGINFNELVNDFENHLISLALSRTQGNKKAAAELLQLNRTTLVEKIKKKGLCFAIEKTVAPEVDPLFRP